MGRPTWALPVLGSTFALRFRGIVDQFEQVAGGHVEGAADSLDQLQRGVLLVAGASLDPEHWLCFGLDDRLPVLVSGSFAYMSKHPVATPVRLLDKQRLRLSGLMWPEARRRRANTAYATVESVGRGQIILFSADPFFRGYWEGTGTAFMIFGLAGC